MQLQQLNENHFEALFDFETRNRDWFALSVPPRPESYRTMDGFSHATTHLLAEQHSGESHFFVAIEKEKIVARANLVDIASGSADVGYRVCAEQVGKGVATNALQALIAIAQQHLCLTQLTAKTTNNNLASIRVLQKLGFNEIVTEVETFEMNGENVSFVYFIKKL